MIRRPMGGEPKMNRKEVEAMMNGAKKVGSAVKKGVKSYAKNVVGGAKIVGGVIKKVIQYPGKQIEKEMKMNKVKDDMDKEMGEMMNKEYSGVARRRGTSSGYMVR